MAWQSSIDSKILAVHAALVPSGVAGEVVFFGGDEHWIDQQESQSADGWKKTRIYDVATHTVLDAVPPSPSTDVFCAGHAFAGDGRLLIGGGTWAWPVGDHHDHPLDFLGHRRCWLYNPRARKWIEAGAMQKNPAQPMEEASGGRWYPGLVTLANGDVFTVFGHPAPSDIRHRNTLPERYHAGGNFWTLYTQELATPAEPVREVAGPRFLFYLRMFALPDGTLFFATPMPVDFATASSGDGTYFSTRFDPATGTYVGPKIPEPMGYHDWFKPAVLLPLLPHSDPEQNYRARVLFAGTTAPLVIDLSAATPAWTPTIERAPSMVSRNRTHSNIVLLPNGEVCVIGGLHVANPEDPVLQPEIYRPGINWTDNTYSEPQEWQVKDAGAFARNYHSSALLLPNGKVWVAGGNINEQSGDPATVGIRNIEVYEPDYIAVANRIQITDAPRLITYGQSFNVSIDRAATQAQRVALIRAGSATHSTNNDQRYVGVVIGAKTGNTLQLVAPPNGNVAPPGYYMLFVVDNAGNPCQLARFVRIAHVSCSVVTDRSTFSQEEVAGFGGETGAVSFANALYVYYDGFLSTELTGTPSFELRWQDTNELIDPANLSVESGGRLLETPADPDVPQRITYPFGVRFGNMANLYTFPDRRTVRITFTLGPHVCSETFDLTKQPNPYMTDVNPLRNNPHWLSTDVRVFKIIEGPGKAGVPLATGGDAPINFIRSLITALNGNHALFTDSEFPEDPNAAPLDLWTHEGPKPLYNFAIAKVRYRATTTTASNVRCFFRMFNTVATALQFNPNTTYKRTPGPNPVPLLGREGNALVSIPFFASPRVDSTAVSMETQTLDDTFEIHDIAPASGAENVAFFGCWLDINNTLKRFPLDPGLGDGPWSASQCAEMIQHVRGRHMCLVAEVVFADDPTNANDTPGSSDNLSQRNLAILHSDNPGGPASHTVMHTFEVKPSTSVPLPFGVTGFAAASKQRHAPDQLLFRWNNLPRNSEVTLYFSDIDTADILAYASTRISPPAFTVINNHTIRLHVAGATWLPLPGNRDTRIPALLSIKLPDDVVYGQTFRVSVHQVSGGASTILGAFELKIPVTAKELIVEEETRTLSVMRYIAKGIPSTDRWYAIFQRYLHHLADKVDALGGDAKSVHPNPDGSGTPYVPPRGDQDGGRGRAKWCAEGVAVSLILAIALVLCGVATSPVVFGGAAVAAIVLLAIAIGTWRRKCGHMRCALLDHLALGSAAAAGVLLLLRRPSTVLFAAALLMALFLVLSFALGCRGGCCDPKRDCP